MRTRFLAAAVLGTVLASGFARGETGAAAGTDGSGQASTGIPPGLDKYHQVFREECGFLVNQRSLPALEPFFAKELPAGEGLGTHARSPDLRHIFLALLLEIFNLVSDPSEPCP
ncbi:MAG: hypothetical protein HY509_03015 [Acidobacteria bacterium]|nr:hypothetical protein [Acidobacteriota bacterium]